MCGGGGVTVYVLPLVHLFNHTGLSASLSDMPSPQELPESSVASPFGEVSQQPRPADEMEQLAQVR